MVMCRHTPVPLTPMSIHAYTVNALDRRLVSPELFVASAMMVCRPFDSMGANCQ